MLQNAFLLAKIGADTAENEQHFAEILPIGRRVADRWTRRADGTLEHERLRPARDGRRAGGPPWVFIGRKRHRFRLHQRKTSASTKHLRVVRIIHSST